MSDDNSGDSGGCGCGGCVMLVIFIFMVAAIGFGVPIGVSKWNIDIFPPRIWDMNDPAQNPELPQEKPEVVEEVEKVEEVEEPKTEELKTEE